MYNPAKLQRDKFRNYVDESSKDPGFYIGSTLVTKKYVRTYSLPGVDAKGEPIGQTIKKFAPGDTVGVIDSYIVDKKTGGVWWMLTNHEGYIRHWPGWFDQNQAVTTSSGKKFNEMRKEADKISLNPAPLIGKTVGAILDIPYIKPILIGIVLLIVLSIVLRFKN
jgi:hypothetical protein